MTKDWIFCPKIQNPQKGFKILSPNPNGVDFQDFLDPSIQSFQPLYIHQKTLKIGHVFQGFVPLNWTITECQLETSFNISREGLTDFLM